MKNPKTYDFGEPGVQRQLDAVLRASPERLIEQLTREGFDALVIRLGDVQDAVGDGSSRYGGNQVVVFDPRNIMFVDEVISASAAPAAGGEGTPHEASADIEATVRSGDIESRDL